MEPVEARARLVQLLRRGRGAAAAAADYASAAADAFAPREREGEPQVMLAEAGTGIGKTLGYLAPASLWARKQRGAGLAHHLHPRPAAPDRPGARPRLSRLRREGAAGSWSARAARTTSAC